MFNFFKNLFKKKRKGYIIYKDTNKYIPLMNGEFSKQKTDIIIEILETKKLNIDNEDYSIFKIIKINGIYDDYFIRHQIGDLIKSKYIKWES